MCGRYGISVTKDELTEYLREHYSIDVFDQPIELPTYNIAPGNQVISLINDGYKYRVGLLKWGFVPSWAKDESAGYKLINARSETLKDKPVFKKSYFQRRCIIIADGFFEWYRTTSTKTPYYFYLKSHKIFGFAGLWTAYKKPNGKTLFTTTIITTKANTLMKDIHDRMPVILTEESAKIWLNPAIQDSQILDEVLTQFDPNEMGLHEVSSRVNKPINNDADIIKPIK